MLTSPVITKYLIRRFAWYLFLTSIVLFSILLVSGTFGTLQKFKSIHIQSEDFWLLVGLKIPYLFNEISSIIGFISTILFLGHLSIHNELIVMVSNGIPVWRIFVIPIFMSFIFGVAIITVINPLGAYSMREYEKLEAKLDNSPLHNNLIISKTDIFFSEKYQDTDRIIKLKSINITKKSISDITILSVNAKNELIQRIDSSFAELDNNQFRLYSPLVTTTSESSKLNELYLPTNLSIDNLRQRLISQEMVSIWGLPELIDKLGGFGVPILDYQIYFFKQLFKPFATLAMALLACWFVKFDNRNNSGVKDKAVVVIAGISTYFILEISLRILAYGGLAPIFSVLLPISLIILIGNFVILHFHES